MLRPFIEQESAMRAVQSDVRSFLEGSKQFVLPLYQRRYSWHKKHWKTLARDLDRLLKEADRPSHFIGSFVAAPLNVTPEQNISRFRLIDGQQRLTTLLILLAALRDHAAQSGEQGLADKLQGTLLSNQYEKADAAKKLIPTADDRAEFDDVVSRRPAKPGPSRVGDAYRFWQARFSALPADQWVGAVDAALKRLSVVSITLEGGDDPHLIFESLNAKGERLTQADLLRNYFLMRLPADAADAEFARLWQPMERSLGKSLTEFFRHFLMRDADDAEVRRDEVYDRVKERVDSVAFRPQQVVDRLEEITRYAAYYARLIDPTTEPDEAVRERITRLHALKVTTAYPFLMVVHDRIDAGKLTPAVMPVLLDKIESFLVRRLVSGVPTNQLRVIFRGLCREAAEAADDESFTGAVVDALARNQRCPTDAVFADAIVRRPVYGGSKRDVARYLLERIERATGHKEGPDPSTANVQLEHVLPQKLTAAWSAALEADDPKPAAEQHAQWLHTLGNLTLTGYNPELGNADWQRKRTIYGDSNFELNKYFKPLTAWHAQAIMTRGQALAERAVGIWQDLTTQRTADEAKGPVEAVILGGQRHDVTSMLQAACETLAYLYGRSPDRFLAAAGEHFSAKRRGVTAAKMRAPRQIGERFYDLHGSAERLEKICRRIRNHMGVPYSAIRFIHKPIMN